MTNRPAKIAYLAGQYPQVSLTFIQREIEAIRALGLDVVTCSIRQTPPEQHPGIAEKEAARTSFYVLKAGRNPFNLLAAQSYAFVRPGRYLSALKLAWKTRAPGLKAAIYQLAYFVEATLLSRHLEAEKVTHIHNHFTTGSATVAMLANALTGIPYSFTLHGPADLLEPYRWRLDEKTARAKFVATISHYARAQLMFFSDPAHWDRLHIIHCGVNPETYAADAPPEDYGQVRLVFVGRIAPVKGLRLLVAAMKEIGDSIPGLQLILVGDGPDRTIIETLAAPLKDRIYFTGYRSQSEVAEILKTADICVLPSFAEGVPVFLMEALASGKPIIATQVAGVGELVKSGENGLLVSPGDVDGLVDAIRDLSDDPARRTTMGENGRQRVAQDFDIRIEAARLARLFVGVSSDLRPEPLSPLDNQPES